MDGRLLLRLTPALGQLVELRQVALQARQAAGHDRHVDEDQRKEDQIGGRDVLAGLVEG